MGINHSFSERRWPISAIVYLFLFCVIVVIHKHIKLKQKRCENDVRLRRFGSS